MARRKLKHFAEMKEMTHVFEPTLAWERGEPLQLKGTWGANRDTGLRPAVILELACGGGAYTVALAQRFPKVVVVGVDIKGSRMWHGARQAAALGLTNAKFLRTQIEQLGDYFADAEVDEIWITFPNPHPTKGNAKRRLTSRRFLEIYRRILKPGGFLHLKTDDAGLFEFTLEVLPLEGFTVEEVFRDVHSAPDAPELLKEVQTQYEQRYVKEGKAIKYLRAVLS